MDRKHIALLFGGQSAEHEISLISASNVYNAINKEKYHLSLIAITKSGEWRYIDSIPFLHHPNNAKKIALNFECTQELLIKPGQQENKFYLSQSQSFLKKIDMVFPILHGPHGEDGSLQGLLKLCNIPFIGSDVMSSAISMDKDIMKRLMVHAKIPITPYQLIYKWDQYSFEMITQNLGLPLFIKPCNMGSSVGVYKVKDKTSFDEAVKKAFQYDDKLIIEQAIQGREIEVAILGHQSAQASEPGEIIPQSEFYSYEAKYIDEKGAILKIPSDLSSEIASEIKNLALKVFKLLDCKTLARVDFFVTYEDEIIVNEINTIPGFTSISMYPQLWQHSGIEYENLIEKLILSAEESYSI